MRNMMGFGITRELGTTQCKEKTIYITWEFQSSQNLGWEEVYVDGPTTRRLHAQISTPILYWEVLWHNKEKFNGFPNFSLTTQRSGISK